MTNGPCLGVVRNRAVVFEGGQTPWPEGTPVLVTPIPAEPGTAAALLAASTAEPALEAGDVEELNRAIAEAAAPPAGSPF
jgi:hypothetical protein